MRTGSIFALATFVLVFISASAACSGESKLGEACDESGKTEDECESGSVCGQNTSGALMCLKVCVDQAGCTADQECNGVEGTNVKGCRTKSGTGTGTGTGDGGGGGTGDGGKK